MAAPDMDVIKEIPGYKVILKAVLKNQIQQLVEQLASHTEEESIILTASVSDGTLSHLGSDSGKYFLDDHEDVKSQFLGFCLKHHHKKKQKEKEDKEREQQERELERQRQMMPTTPSRYSARPRYMSPQGPRGGFSPRQASYVIRSPGARHEPYPISRPQKRPSMNFNPPAQSPASGGSPLTANNQVIKVEPNDEDSNQSASGSATPKQGEAPSSQPSSPSQGQPGTIKSDADDDVKSNSSNSNSNIPSEASEMKFSDTQPAEGLGLDSDLSNLISGEQSGDQPSSSVSSDVDPNVNIKLEAISENDMELEITGVEPGMSSLDTSWAQNTSMGYDPSGATGNQADMQGQEGYKVRGGMDTVDNATTSDWKIKDVQPKEEEAQTQEFNESDLSDLSDWEVSSAFSISSADLDPNDIEDSSDEEWMNMSCSNQLGPFTEAVGPSHNIPSGAHPIQFFDLLFEEDFFEMIAHETNLYAEQQQKKKSDTRWKETSVDEIRAFFSIMIIMGVHRLPEYSLYWSDDKNLNVQGISEVMPKARFEKLRQYLHLTNNEEQPAKDSPLFDPLFKVQSLLDMVNRNFLEHYTPSKEVSVDRTVIRFRDNLQRNKSISGYGIKILQLSESETGYTSQLQICLEGGKPNKVGQGPGHKVVMDLLQPFMRRNYHIYFGQALSSIPLLSDLIGLETFGCGMVRLKNLQQMKSSKLRQNGDSMTLKKGSLLVTLWNIKTQVAVISTNLQQHDQVDGCKQEGHVPGIYRPSAVTKYKRYSGGVDLAERIRSSFSIGRENKKWWKSVLYHCMDVALVNAYLLYTASNQDLQGSSRQHTQLNFRLQVADALRGGFSSRKNAAGKRAYMKAIKPVLRSQNVIGHMLVRIEGRMKTCVQCSLDGNQTKKNFKIVSSFKCLQCDVPLCRKNNCFLRYHQGNLI